MAWCWLLMERKCPKGKVIADLACYFIAFCAIKQYMEVMNEKQRIADQ
jgi:hypothetical protein